MSLINDTLEHFFLEEYANTEANKFVHLHKTGWKFDESMFLSPADQSYTSEAVASALLAAQCDRIITIPGSVNANVTGANFSDTYEGILYNMISIAPGADEYFTKAKDRAIDDFEDNTSLYIDENRKNISYRNFFTTPEEWYKDDGWHNRAYSKEFSLKTTESSGNAGTLIKPVFKGSPALSDFMLRSAGNFAIADHRISSAATAAVPPARMVIRDHRTHTDSSRMPIDHRSAAPVRAAVRDHRKAAAAFRFPETAALRAMHDAFIRRPENVISHPVEAESLSISFLYKVLPVTAPWLHLPFFGNTENRWQLPFMKAGQLSTGENGISNTGSMPSYISDIIIVKDVSISGKFTKADIDSLNKAFGFEAFDLTDKQIPQAAADGTTIIEDKGMQVLGFVCTVFPLSPAYSTPDSIT